MMIDLLGIFPNCARVRTKWTKKDMCWYNGNILWPNEQSMSISRSNGSGLDTQWNKALEMVSKKIQLKTHKGFNNWFKQGAREIAQFNRDACNAKKFHWVWKNRGCYSSQHGAPLFSRFIHKNSKVKRTWYRESYHGWPTVKSPSE